MSKHYIAVFVSPGDRRTQLANRLEARGMKVLLAQSSEELCSYINSQRIDAVVVEQSLGGFLTGLEILQRLREQLLRPLLVVIGTLDEREKHLATEIRVDYVCSWDQGIDRICKSLSDMMGLARHKGFLIPAAARQLVADAEHIGVMPQLVVQLTQYLKDEDTKVSDLARDISSDPSVTGELMKMVNSAAFGLKSNVTDVESIVKYLGIRRTVSLVLELSFHTANQSWYESLSHELMNWFGLRSVVNACVASSFASHHKDVSHDTVYVLSLLQDIGILVLCQVYGPRYTHLLSHARTVAQVQLDRIEKSELSFTHADVSAALLQHWEFPPSMIQLILEHHNAPKDLSDSDRKFLQFMQLGESVANLRDVPSPQRHLRFEKCLAQSGTRSFMDVKSCIATAIQQSREVTSYFDLAVPEKDNWWTLIQQMQECLNGNGTESDTGDSPEPREQVPVLMVIDDEPAIGKMLQLFLKDLPLKIDYHMAAPSHSQVGPDVMAVMCDVHLAGDSGVKFVRELRACGFTKPVLMISGDRTRQTVLDSISAGVVDYIAKPFTKQAVLEKLRKHGLIPLEESQPLSA